MAKPPSDRREDVEAWFRRRPAPNQAVRVSPSECLALAEAGDFAVAHALATLNNLHHAQLPKILGQELTRNLEIAHQRLYDALIPFRDRAARCADGLFVTGPGIRGPADDPQNFPGSLPPWSHRRLPPRVEPYAVGHEVPLANTPRRVNRDGLELAEADEPCTAVVLDVGGPEAPDTRLMVLPSGSTFWATIPELQALASTEDE